MTEAEAKTKMCPKMFGWVRHVEDQPVSWAFGNCCGSACMAWRWSDPSLGEMSVTHAGSYSEGELQRMSQGYCGLAGRP